MVCKTSNTFISIISALVSNHLFSSKDTDYSYISRTVSQKQVDSNNQWIFELGVKSGDELPIYCNIGFQNQDRFSVQIKHKIMLYSISPDIIECSCVIGSTKFPDCNEYQVDFERNKYNDSYNEVRRFYEHFIQGEGKPYISFKDYKELYPFIIFALRQLKKMLLASQSSSKQDFVSEQEMMVLEQNLQAIGLLLTQKIISVSSDAVRQFDIM